MFCQVTGYSGTTQRVEQAFEPSCSTSRSRVTFDANVASGLPWEFKPLQREVTMKIGETVAGQVPRRRTSSNEATRGQAIFNVTPVEAAPISTRCSASASPKPMLKPGETRDMPVVFYVDPDIVKAEETKDIEDDHPFLHLLPA